MSPVRTTSPRTVILAMITFLVGALVVVVLFVFAVGKATESGRFEINLGSDTFDAGTAQLRAESIGHDGPLLLPDVAGGQRDIYLQHEGSDPDRGWLAFDARRPGAPRDCQLVWDRSRESFGDSCDGSAVPPDGNGLPHYPVEVTDQHHVVVNLNPERKRPTTTTASTAPESTTSSSIRVTGAPGR